MSSIFSTMFLAPTRLEVWLVLGYVLSVAIGANVIALLARWHFSRARDYNERGFEYDPEADHYQCPAGQHLKFKQLHSSGRIAVYHATASVCNQCPLKHTCTPHDHGRHIYRALAEWAETDVGRFHHGISLLMFCIGAAVSLIALIHWISQPGSGLLAVSLVAHCGSIVRVALSMKPRPAAAA